VTRQSLGVAEDEASAQGARRRARHTFCREDELPHGAVRIEDVDGKEIGVINVDGTLYAMRNVCPHAGAPICRGAVTGTLTPSSVGTFNYGMENLVIRCPWHRFQFDLRTGLPLSELGGKLRMYDARIEDGDVVVYV
jgi:nitrite reductase/ring-hydroxylating ferredoxin subunit